MPIRQRSTSARTPKTPPPLAEETPLAEKDRSTRSASSEQSQKTAGDDAEIMGSSLERREIPSFSDSRAQRIAEAAYWRAERRGFQPGHELDDWLEAEREVDSQRPDPSLDQRPDGRTG